MNISFTHAGVTQESGFKVILMNLNSVNLSGGNEANG